MGTCNPYVAGSGNTPGTPLQVLIPLSEVGFYYRGDKVWAPLDKIAVGLDQVDNTSDLQKPLSAAVIQALTGYQPLSSKLSAIAALNLSTQTGKVLRVNAAGNGFDLGAPAEGASIDDEVDDAAPLASMVTRSATKIAALISTAITSALSGALATVARFAPNRAGLAAAAFTAAPCYLAEGQRSGWFVFDSSDLSAMVAADPLQGLFVAKASDPTGASGAWVRQWDGSRAQVKWWGGIWNGVADDGPVVDAAKTAVYALSGGNYEAYGVATPSLVFPFNKTKINMGSTKLVLTKTTAFYGESSPNPGGFATVLQWNPGTTGIKIETTAPNCYFDGLLLEGGMLTANVEGEYQGIDADAPFSWGRLGAWHWQGNGIHCDTNDFDPAGTDGQKGEFLSVLGNRCGVYINGNNSNASNYGTINAWYNRRVGVLDNSGLGNHYDTVMTHANGLDGKTCCFNNGHVFYVISGQEAGASTNGPPATATDNQWWGYWKDAATAGVSWPQWAAGMTWRAGGGMLVPLAAASNNSRVDYYYVEADQPPTQTAQAVLLGNGTRGTPDAPFTRSIQATSEGIEIRPKVKIGALTFNDGAFMSMASGLANSYRWDLDATGLRFSYGGATSLFKIVKPGSSMGVTVDDHGVYFEQGSIWLGTGGNYRRITVTASSPNGSMWAANGAIAFNAGYDGAPSTAFAWMCVGYPLNWAPVYAPVTPLAADVLDEWSPNFTANGSILIPARKAMTIAAGNAPVGTGALAYEKSTAAAPGTFAATTLPATLEAGAWLKVTASGVAGTFAAHLVRTA